MNIIDEREFRTIYRKLQKKKYDELIALSVDNGGDRVRLLDEGMVVDAYGNPLFYLMKGTIDKYYESLPDDYEGSINLGHMEFATFPFLLGKWTKKDLHVVDIGDGRKGLDVDLRLDSENVFVKELRRAEYTLGVSAEFGFHVNEEFTEKYGIEILDDIFISDFAIVGECGNVGSSGIRLKGGKGMTVKDLTAAIEGGVDLTEVNKKLDALLADETTEEVAQEEVSEPQEETKEEAVEEVAAEEEEAVEEPEEKQEEVDKLAEVLATVEGLKQQIAELQAEKEALSAKLAAKTTKEQEFLNKFKTLAASVAKKETIEEPIEEKDIYTDGIGE